MAYYILNTPGQYYSFNDDLIFTVRDDVKPYNQVTYPDYKYICDIYIGTDFVVRLKAVPHPVTKIGLFNIENIVRSYSNVYFNPVSNNILVQHIGEGEFYRTVQCKFGEEYGFVTYTNVAIDAQRIYFNHYNTRFGHWDANARTQLINVLDKPMTVRPYATPVYRNAINNYLSFLATDDTQIDLEIKSYRGNTNVGTINQGIQPLIGSFNLQEVLNLSPYILNLISSNFINDSIDYYTVKFGTTNISDDVTLRFNLVCEPKYEVFTVHFLNRYGAFETKNFTKVSRKIINSERSEFSSQVFSVDPNSGYVDYQNSSGNRTADRITYAVEWSEKMVLNSDFLTDAEYLWLQDLILSPYRVIELFGAYYSFTISKTDYEIKKNINDDLTNLTIEIELANKFNTQFQ